MISNTKSTGSSFTFPERTNLDPSGNGSDIGADRQLIDYDSVSSDDLNKEMSSQTLGGNFDLYAKFFRIIVYLPRDNKSGTFGKGLVLVTS